MGKNIFLTIYKNPKFKKGIYEILEKIKTDYEYYIKFLPKKYLEFDDNGNVEDTKACEFFWPSFRIDSLNGVGIIYSDPKIFDESIVKRILEFWEMMSRNYFFEEIVIIDCQELDYFDEGRVFYYNRGKLYYIDDFGIINTYYISEVIKQYNEPILSKEALLEKEKQKKEKQEKEKEKQKRERKEKEKQEEEKWKKDKEKITKLIEEFKKRIGEVMKSNLKNIIIKVQDSIKKKERINNIIILGNAAVGKTTFIVKYVDDEYDPDTNMTNCVDFYLKEISRVNKNYKFLIWDVLGVDRFKEFVPFFANEVDGAIIICDLTRSYLFQNLEEWINLVREIDDTLPVLLLGTKLDLENVIEVDDDYTKSLHDKFNMIDYLKISSKTGENVEKAFNLLFEKIIQVPNLKETDYSLIRNKIELLIYLKSLKFTDLEKNELEGDAKSYYDELFEQDPEASTLLFFPEFKETIRQLIKIINSSDEWHPLWNHIKELY